MVFQLNVCSAHSHIHTIHVNQQSTSSNENRFWFNPRTRYFFLNFLHVSWLIQLILLTRAPSFNIWATPGAFGTDNAIFDLQIVDFTACLWIELCWSFFYTVVLYLAPCSQWERLIHSVHNLKMWLKAFAAPKRWVIIVWVYACRTFE